MKETQRATKLDALVQPQVEAENRAALAAYKASLRAPIYAQIKQALASSVTRYNEGEEQAVGVDILNTPYCERVGSEVAAIVDGETFAQVMANYASQLAEVNAVTEVPDTSSYADKRLNAYMAEWSLHRQLEALTENEQGRPQKLAALLAFIAQVKQQIPKPE